jgi:SHS2 domain-containing protein
MRDEEQSCWANAREFACPTYMTYPSSLIFHPSSCFMYEIFEHTADLGLRVRAPDLASLFADAGRGLTSMIAANLDSIEPVREVPLRVSGNRRDDLLFDWLSEILYLFESEHLLLRQFEVQFDDNGLSATARGEPLDEIRHQLEHEVKAITYHGLKVEQTPEGWLAEVIVDI